MVDIVIANRFRRILLNLSAVGLIIVAAGCTKSAPKDPLVTIDGDDSGADASDNSGDDDDGTTDAGDSDDIVIDLDASDDPDAAVANLPDAGSAWRAVTAVAPNPEKLMPEIAAVYIVPPDGGASYVAIIGSLTDSTSLTAAGYPSGTGDLTIAVETTGGGLDFGPWNDVTAPTGSANAPGSGGGGLQEYTSAVSQVGPTASYAIGLNHSGAVTGILTAMWRRSDGYVVGIWGIPGSAGQQPAWQNQIWFNSGSTAFEGSLVTENPTPDTPSDKSFATFVSGNAGLSIFSIAGGYGGTGITTTGWASTSFSSLNTLSGVNIAPTSLPLQYGVASTWTLGGGQKLFTVSNNQVYWAQVPPPPSTNWSALTMLTDPTGRGPIVNNVTTAPSAVWCGKHTILVTRDGDGNIWQSVRNPATKAWSTSLIADVTDRALPAALVPPALDGGTTQGIAQISSPAVISRTSNTQATCEYEVYIVGLDQLIYEKTFIIN